MRDLLDRLDSIAEATLDPATITKYPERYDNAIRYLRGAQPRFYFERQPPDVEEPFVTAAPDLADEWEELRSQGRFSGQNVRVRDTQGRTWPLSQFRKTSEFGGQAAKPGEDSEIGKETALLKPSQIGITDKSIPARSLGREIINNPVLQSTDYGQIVIGMARQIMAGNNPTVPAELRGTKILDSIRDYAGEYLGVLALVQGVSDFPDRDDFQDWLQGSVQDLVLEFPSKANTNIADSFANITNKRTQHTINISSKGEGGGAPPSVGGLKIPPEIRNNPEFATAVDFIDLADTSRSGGRFTLPEPKTVSQVFQAMNLLHDRVPESVPDKFRPFLPWDISVVDEVMDSIRAFKDRREVSLPRYRRAWQDIQFKKPSSDGGKLVHAVKLAVMEAVNEGQGIPNFQDVILMILGMNFIQQYANLDRKSGTMRFQTQWPAQLRGQVSLESKSGATDPTKGGFSFKLANTQPVTRLEQPDEGGAEPSTRRGTRRDTEQEPARSRVTARGRSDDSQDEPEEKTLGRRRRS